MAFAFVGSSSNKPEIPSGGLTIAAWVNQDLGSEHQNGGKIFISAGAVENFLLAKPRIWPIGRSAGPLALACHESLDFECVLAFVDRDGSSFNIVTHVFTLSNCAGNNGCDVVPNAGLNIPVDTTRAFTSSRIALFFNAETTGSKFILVTRTQEATQPLRAFTSSDGTFWSFETTLSPTSFKGPTTVPYWRSTTNRVYINNN
jgi:hypothetical protein